ncbi:serine/threonine-protein kinase pim-1-like isoform X2 [Vidua chalybeata]|uniref:serine/threonine-protein kinase pim-1-like isoform X2 n=1 Tax=Vidua chalybeata TaxID=81927 RepID=UPI0023A7C545|nr:serine/threonine-protein kinase pim-1-like isoform X2 [Vidua chalybeata]
MPGRAMPPARPRPRAGLSRPRPRPSRRGLAPARLWPCWRWRCWAGISAWGWGGIASLWLRLARARPQPRRGLQSRPRPRLLPGPAEDTGGAAAAAASAAASPARAPPLGSAAAGPEPPLSRCQQRTPGGGRPGALGGRSGAAPGPGPSADSRVPPAGKAQEALQERYRLGSLLGSGGFGSVFAATRLSDGAPPDGTSAPLEIVLLAKVASGCAGIIQLLEWLELPDSFLLVLERPERCQDLSGFLAERRFLPEEEARGLFRQVLEAVRHCTSCGVLHRDIKPQNILLDLATGRVKLIDFGCGAFLQDTAYTQFAGTLSYSPPEWIHHHRYHGEAATIWSLGLLLCHLVMGKHPFRRGQEIIWGWILFPRRLSQGGSSSLATGQYQCWETAAARGHPALAAAEDVAQVLLSCSPPNRESMGKFRPSSGHTQHGLGMGTGGQLLQLTGDSWSLSAECQDVIKRCLSMQPLDRPSLEELFHDPWVQGVPLP